LNDRDEKLIGQVEGELINWANGKPAVLNVWIYGSRTCGRARDNSDLDIGIELDKSARPEVWDGLPESWRRETEALACEIRPLIQQILGVIPPHVRFVYSDTHEPDFRGYVAKGRRIFWRHQNSRVE